MKIKLKRLSRYAKVPTYSTEHSAALDLYATESVTLHPGDVKIIRSGWAFEIPNGYYVEIVPRSSLACKNQLIILNSPGIIDADYRGEVFTYMKNIGDSGKIIQSGDRYAQMLLKGRIPVWFEEVEELSETSRGSGGFGSTGV